ncbi:GspE/PulE family protein [Sphingosinicella terrae]|uniref:GspE/PulE family protein n=1 Tax=Sphingosinicella terrae TaxID=2172047 RepID=UPI000E0D6205|nr:GspE/PulE family protein [Sphingosinicella terrae]
MEFRELLLDRNIVTPAELARAEEMRGRTGGRLPSTLVQLGLASEADVAETMAAASGAALLDRESLPAALVEIDGLNPAFLQRHALLPMALDGGVLRIAAGDPGDEEGLSGLAFAAGAESIEISVASLSDIQEVITAHFGNAVSEEMAERADDWSDDLERLLDGESEAPVIRLVQRLLAGAVDRRASDVHVEPMVRQVAVRYRIDGRLNEVETLPSALAGPIASRIKVMAGLDIAESRLPQDGRLRLTVRGQDIDVRVATAPVAHGESVVLRLLGRSSVPLDLEKLGLPEPALAALLRAIERPHGIILVTGPTGSGKTTTLYAAVNRLRRPDVKILTVEDPVEVVIEGVNQVQVRPEIDLTYAKTLRAFLRQDPDILMIGEIRDQETAEIALRAALTGHLVLSTLHTNNALGAFTRLADIGVEPYLTASTVIAAVAQRLIRAVCTACRGERAPSASERRMFEEAGLPAPKNLAQAQGCAKCGGTGYSGRLPMIEVVEVDEALRGRIRDGDVEAAQAERPPAETLLGHGLALVAAGRTTMEEMRRAVQAA